MARLPQLHRRSYVVTLELTGREDVAQRKEVSEISLHWAQPPLSGERERVNKLGMAVLRRGGKSESLRPD